MEIHSTPPASNIARSSVLLTVSLTRETDVVTARQRARQLARLLGFDAQDQIRLATATSEIARNVIQYARSGRVEFGIGPAGPGTLQNAFVVTVSDAGPGIRNLQDILDGNYASKSGLGVGLTGTRRMMDHFTMESAVGEGTRVTFAKELPAAKLTASEIGRITEELARDLPKGPEEELRQQNREALATIEMLRRSETELRRVQDELLHLNQELEATNRGVVALYAELDQRAEALRAANEIKTHFLSHMSHEFRTPLNSILALTTLLTRRTDGDLTPDQDKQVGYIRTAAEELFEMVNDLLDLAKVEAGKLEMKYSEVRIGRVMDALRGLLRPLSTSDRVNLVFDDVDPSLRLTTDEGKLAQILRNLISNALKFTEAGEVRISADCGEGSIFLRVADTGIGIAPVNQTRIFEEFAQIDNPLQRKVRGTGLGLPLSRKLAELLGGTLKVESTLGVGSTFTLTLPYQVACLGATVPAAEILPPPVESVLIIDDSERDRYLVRQIFRGAPFRIIEAANGSEGTERARFERPALIILDIVMPGMTGFDVLDELKSDPQTSSIPVVIHSSVALNDHDRARLDNRQAAILPKGAVGQEQGLKLFLDIMKGRNVSRVAN